MERAKEALVEIRRNLEEGIIPFWVEKGVDKEYGGYLTCFDVHGNLGADTDKYIVTQARMIWGLSALYEEYGEERLRRAAQQGYGFFVRHFWDAEKGGWYWKTARDGTRKKLLIFCKFTVPIRKEAAIPRIWKGIGQFRSRALPQGIENPLTSICTLWRRTRPSRRPQGRKFTKES